MKDIKKLVRPNILRLEPYSTARDEFQGKADTWLDANESPYSTGWNRYPDPRQKALRAKIAQLKEIPQENIFLGNGSDEAIDLIYRIFCNPGRDNVVAIAPTYGMYSVAARINDVEYREVPLGEGFSLDGDALLKASDSNTKVIFLCSPNNPTGNAFDTDEMAAIAGRFDGIVVVDEAYIDFGYGDSMTARLAECPNLIVLQTLSKARGMAALRIGMAFADKAIIDLMNNVKYPYNISAAAAKAALEGLEKDIEAQLAEIRFERREMLQNLVWYNCVEKVYPSQGNFVLAKVTDPDAVYDHLLKDGIVVRNRSRVKGCEGCLRITVGTPDENERLFKSLGEYEKSNIRR